MFPQLHFSIERWRKNEEYGVWVSNQGRIRLIKNKEFLTTRVNSKGYLLVFTEKGLISVHRLVAYTWLGDKRNEKYTIDHINFNKRDNSVKNLRWVSAEINQAYAKLTFINNTVEETEPQTSTEEDMIIVLNNKLDEKTRGRALKALHKTGKMIIKADNELLTDETILQMSHKLGNNANLEDFYGRILKASAAKKKYCGFNWHVEAVGE